METRSIMMTAAQPFSLPRQLPRNLAAIHQYWKLLIRAENPMPFSDDVTLGPIEKLHQPDRLLAVLLPACHLMLVRPALTGTLLPDPHL